MYSKSAEALKRLNPKHQAMVKSFTTPGPNMGVMTAAGHAADPSRSSHAARVAAYRAFHHPEVREAIEEEMAKHGAGIGWRIKTLRAVGDPDTVITEEKETTKQVTLKGSDGDAILPAAETTKTVTRRSPSPSDIARIVDTLNKMDGTYAQQNAQAQVSARYATLAGRFHAILGNVQPETQEDVPIVNECKEHRARDRYVQHVGLIPTVRGSANLFQQGHAPNAHSEATANAGSVKADSCTA